ncbi:MAG TPA: hypothetical protein VF060_19375 [Trebonia sp.]
MRDSADPGDLYDTEYARPRRGNRGRRKQQFDDEVFAKTSGHRPRLRAEDADDATDGLPEGDRWSTWDQTKMFISNDLS